MSVRPEVLRELYGLDGQVAVVTGAGTGMGAATSRLVAALGARVVLVDVDEAAARTVADEIAASGAETLALGADVRRPEDVQRYVDEALARFERIDLFHNNAGIIGATGPVIAAAPTDFDAAIDVNLRGAFLGLRAVGAVMAAQRSGAIVATASVAGLRASAGQAIYAASKFGLLGLVRSVARELAPAGVRVNAIAPTATATRFAGGVMSDNPEAAGAYAAQIPLGRVATAQDMAKVVAFLFSDAAAYLSGVVVPVDGGQSA